MECQRLLSTVSTEPKFHWPEVTTNWSTWSTTLRPWRRRSARNKELTPGNWGHSSWHGIPATLKCFFTSGSVERLPPTYKTVSSQNWKGFGTSTEIDIALFQRSSTEVARRNIGFRAKPHGDLKTDCGSSLSTAELGKSFLCCGDMINGSRHITVAT